MKKDNEFNDEESEINNESEAMTQDLEDSDDIEDLGDIKSISTREITEFIQNDALGTLMNENYLEYASYVLKDRSLPDVFDGLKPVQRRVLHTMNGCDDGRFHKVANIIGATMQYHPHGDASIGDALVTLANKNLFIDTQGNFGNIFTGDGASAPRYIEARLLPLARDVLFNKDITEFVDSYDGRNQEPVCFPAKIPVVLLLGVMGIGVTLRSNIFPHNFNEILEAQILALRGLPFICYPDFLTGGLVDISNYEDGRGSIIARAVIEKTDDKTLTIKEIPAGIPTDKLVESIEKAYKQNKIKIASISDYTAEQVSIEIKLSRGIYADEVLKQLYAYTDCETRLSSSIIVLYKNRPQKMTVTEIIYLVTERLVENLGRELEINLKRLQELYHRKTLARIFIENRIYKRIEECDTEEQVYSEVLEGLRPFRHELLRDITNDDIAKLLDLCIRRISRFDMNKNQQELDAITHEMGETYYYLCHLREYTIDYIEKIKKKYGHLYPRKSKIEVFHAIDVKKVALQNIKVYHDKVGQFIGTAVKASSKDSEPLVCSEFDRLVLLKSDGKIRVTNIADKAFVGIVKYLFKLDKNQIYSMLYREKKSGKWYAKRFSVSSYIVDKEYSLIPEGCIVESIYTTYGVVVKLDLKKRHGEESVEVDFNQILLRAWTARGFKVTDYPVIKTTIIKRGSDNRPLEENIEQEEKEESVDEIITERETETVNKHDSCLKIDAVVQGWYDKAQLLVENLRDYLKEFTPVEKKENEKGAKENQEEEVKVSKITDRELNKKEKELEQINSSNQVETLDLVDIVNDVEQRQKEVVKQKETLIKIEKKSNKEDLESKIKEEFLEEKKAKSYPHPSPLPKGGSPRKLIDEDEDFFLR